ncbi:MAG: FtsX-like permease family protein [Bacteroidota bacterium]
MLLKLAWRNLWRNKRRTLITAASVFFAVLLANFMVSIQNGMYDKMIDDVVGLQMGYAQVHQAGYWEEPIIDNSLQSTPELQEQLRSDPQVKDIVPRLETFALATSGELSRGCLVIGIDPEKENALSQLAQRIAEGRYLKSGSAPGALVAQGLAEKLNLGLGDTIVMIGQGYHAAPAAGKFAITGILRFGNPEMSNGVVYLALPDAQFMYAAEERITSYVLELEQPREAAQVVHGIEERLPGDYEVMDWQTMSPELMQMMEGDKGGNAIIVGVLYMVVGFGIFGTVLMMTAERRHEFGVTVAIGMKRRMLAFVVFLETVFVSLLGVIIGTATAFPIVVYFNRNPIRLDSLAEAYAEFGLEPVLPTTIDPAIFLQQATTVLVIATLISIYPFQRILRLNPVRSMRA